MTVHCHDFKTLMDVVYDCVTRGLRFEANTDKLKVVLTGGY